MKRRKTDAYGEESMTSAPESLYDKLGTEQERGVQESYSRPDSYPSEGLLTRLAVG